MTEITIKGPFIELSKLLKYSGLAQTGGEAKLAIEHGEIKLNGVVETRKGRKVRDSDRVEWAGRVITIKCRTSPLPG
ncbi:MAG TPA: RNA-binding S4 domain-containing protein [Verrucomicrobiae bacterium]|jgi:ribosome-associated protein|nr:RNA-binding S4 domain-containing protein [Verrucomicrobiae bacterium]